ncbi:TetR/AcrR family transcriptional regulator [Streptomyces sp. NPDC002574]|uniref:TetR/AcrR family transcriptional regulator n=1 Tax=Streptomyces sp. NPDC002574 TaxID=3364652 RepID=UPI0036CEC0FD
MTRGATRERIEQTALELFSARGYDRTSLREIAEQLGVTKAAVYYHFRSKEDIVAALFEERLRAVEDVIAWAQAQPPDLRSRREALLRYEAVLTRTAPLSGLFQENRAALRDLAVGAAYHDMMMRALELLRIPGAGLACQLRTITALLVVHGAPKALESVAGGTEEKRAAALTVALELLASAHADGDRPCEARHDTGSPDRSHAS